MADYIKREDAIMTAMDYDGSGNAQDASQDIAAALASIPAADVVDVVHCKKCIHRPCIVNKNDLYVYGPNYDDETCPCLCGDSFYSYIPDDNFYCAYGERRTEDG